MQDNKMQDNTMQDNIMQGNAGGLETVRKMGNDLVSGLIRLTVNRVLIDHL